MSTPSTTPAGQDGAAEATAVEGFSAADTSDIARMSYEQARAELVETVTRLETGGAGLEESLALWERGEALADRCEAWLDGARQRLQEVRARAAGAGADTGPAGA
ncbi:MULTISPECIES: exodeoxyribonuclease VII small subunit [Micrococcaceae]|uniref:exodeoxyribonuclease VII small subunit n=1 Tax=Micrococcaceae TaxID=1268 RepID=UPI00161C71AA|nr:MULTISPECIES: exodeoxyribonuclease VII small subunit [Micrococcaceae]MBB5749473.1 exodeoxyribonuclease VII small subunit [Micrococcus sp. TA1]HRO29592.1 exodeoxyribonuclease VII small subunit [Citricoccus sp.]HRO93589.1 exodeoxyribonuclease VII small subunit [Citricoccus sp.]